MNAKRYYRTQETAGMLGISKQTVLRYEKKGVFPRPRRNSINKWREYSDEEIRELRRILRGDGE